MDAATMAPAGLTEKLGGLRDCLCEGLVERDVAVRLALLAALAGEHLLLLGSPGTAKSLVARRLHLAFSEGHYFERLLTRFTVPEELFGPLSIRGLEHDRYERLTESYLPTASVAFLDETFKANSAILNSLLTILNEREFDNGTRRVPIPLVALVGASNELPQGEELDALFDRFLLRLHLGPVSKDSFPTLLGLRGQTVPDVPDSLRLTKADLDAVRAAADGVEVPGDVLSLLCDLRDWCTAEGIRVSDRRWRKVARLLQVSAATNGRNQVSVWDCWLLQHCLWDKPEERENVHQWYASRVGASQAMDPSRLTRVVAAWEAKLKSDQDSRSQVRDDQGRLLFKNPKGTPTPTPSGRVQAKRDGEPLFLAPADSRTSNWSSSVLKDRTAEDKGYIRSELDALYVHDKKEGLLGFQHWSGRHRYLADESNWLLVDVELPAIIEPTRQKEAYVRSCLKELDQIESGVSDYRRDLAEHIAAMEANIKSHLWVTSDFVEPAKVSLNQTLRDVDTLLRRLQSIQSGFELLPLDADSHRPVEGGGTSGTGTANQGRKKAATTHETRKPIVRQK